LSTAVSNLLLDAIGAGSKADFERHCRIVALERSTVLSNLGDRPRHAYFPLDCVLATLATLSDGSSIEVNIVGREGAFAIVGAIGSGEVAGRVVVLVGGRAVRVPIRYVRAEFEQNAHARAMIVRHFENMLFQVQQSALCAAKHSVEARLSRWLLSIQDRSCDQALHLTHEFVAGHIGANRTSVTLAARSLQRHGLITYRRGVLTITDRAGLEDAACECYGAIKDRLGRLFGWRQLSCVGSTTDDAPI